MKVVHIQAEPLTDSDIKPFGEVVGEEKINVNSSA